MSNPLLAELAGSDKDRYLSLLFAPQGARTALTALYAFHLELQKIPVQVRETQIGLIRLQWWREVLPSIYAGQPQSHPVAQALTGMVVQHHLPQRGLEQMIDAAEQSLCRDRPASLTGLEAYLGQSSAMVMQLASLVLGQSAPEAAGLFGVAYGLARLLHGQPRWFLPEEMLAKEGEDKALRLLIDHAEARWQEARLINSPRACLPAFLPASLTPIYLRCVRANPNRPDLMPPLRRVWTLWRASRHGKL